MPQATEGRTSGNGTDVGENRGDCLDCVLHHFVGWFLVTSRSGLIGPSSLRKDLGRVYQLGAPFLALLALLLYTTIEVGKLSYCVLFTVVYNL